MGCTRLTQLPDLSELSPVASYPPALPASRYPPQDHPTTTVKKRMYTAADASHLEEQIRVVLAAGRLHERGLPHRQPAHGFVDALEERVAHELLRAHLKRQRLLVIRALRHHLCRIVSEPTLRN